MGKTADEMQRAVGLYQAELAKLQHRAVMAASAGSRDPEAGSPNSLSEDDQSSIGLRKKEGEDNDDEEEEEEDKQPFERRESREETFSPDFKFNPMSLGLPPPPVFLPVSGSSSPLQSMASITNSLTAHPIPPPPYRPSQRTFKAILPPITQDQFDRYDSINTEELVRRVKH